MSLHELPLQELRRLLIRIGAQASDLMDTTSGKLYDTNASLVQAISQSSTRSVLPRKWSSLILGYLAGRRSLTLTYNTFCRWLGIEKKLSQKELLEVKGKLHAAQFGTAGKLVLSKDGYVYDTRDTKKNLELQLQTGTRKHIASPVSSLLYGLFAMWCLSQKTMRLDSRAHDLIHRNKHKHHTKKVLFGNSQAPFVDNIHRRAKALAHHDYASTQNCLQNRHRNVYHDVFLKHQNNHSQAALRKQLSENHPVLCALRKLLIGVDQPYFAGKRTLLMNHLFRADGEGRSSVAEVALAIRHKWLLRELPDVVVSRGCRTVQTKDSVKRRGGAMGLCLNQKTSYIQTKKKKKGCGLYDWFYKLSNKWTPLRRGHNFEIDNIIAVGSFSYPIIQATCSRRLKRHKLFCIYKKTDGKLLMYCKSYPWRLLNILLLPLKYLSMVFNIGMLITSFGQMWLKMRNPGQVSAEQMAYVETPYGGTHITAVDGWNYESVVAQDSSLMLTSGLARVVEYFVPILLLGLVANKSINMLREETRAQDIYAVLQLNENKANENKEKLEEFINLMRHTYRNLYTEWYAVTTLPLEVMDLSTSKSVSEIIYGKTVQGCNVDWVKRIDCWVNEEGVASNTGVASKKGVAIVNTKKKKDGTRIVEHNKLTTLYNPRVINPTQESVDRAQTLALERVNEDIQ